ncbi:MAG TPA: cytochrome C oxidase subunit IV family protein [Candidatus Sulfotelmatobacter sp.]|nr:cytochrome C oxidase subunit IV family protein [Candidatus Sulfotelmatobacter sp.]
MSVHATSSPLKTYFAVWVTLLIGTFLTYEVAKIDLGVFNAAVALTIACIKALLVALFFMHLRHASEKLLKVVVISTLFFLFILLSLSMADYATRGAGASTVSFLIAHIKAILPA